MTSSLEQACAKDEVSGNLSAIILAGTELKILQKSGSMAYSRPSRSGVDRG